MAAALQPFHSDIGQGSLFPRLMNDYEFADNGYPGLRPQTMSQQSVSRPTTTERSWQQPTPSSSDGQSRRPVSDSRMLVPRQPNGDQLESDSSRPPSSRFPEIQTGTNDQMQETHRSILSYALPSGAARPVVERYSVDDNNQPSPSHNLNQTTVVESQSIPDTITGRNILRSSTPARVNQNTGRASPNPSLSRRRSPPQNVQNTTPPLPDATQMPPMLPLAASGTYAPPVSPTPRVYPQQPTYVNQSNNVSNPIQPAYMPVVAQQEEVCLECSMRDKDMADVDVSSPGVWERASDVVFEELRRREMEEEAAGIVHNDPTRPRIRGGRRLTEQNLKLWLSINPREPASKLQTLKTYIRSQRALLEAEALAHARALQEAKQLESRMRDTYTQLRRSAYDTGNAGSPLDDFGGVRIRHPSSPTTPAHSRARSRSRDVTLLENGMIVEHVDVRKEEKEARERRKKDEKRARKSSRSSAMDVNSIISQNSGQLVESGLKPSTRFSQANSVRPASVFSRSDRPDIPYAHSQLSFDAQSMGSMSPRRSKFFGMKNLYGGWRSQDSLAPSGVSGSMIDMHLALHRDSYGPNGLASYPIDLSTKTRSQVWPPVDTGNSNASQVAILDEKSKKKVGGLAKIWRKVTGKTDGQQKEYDPPHDDTPLPPPPSLVYLVEGKTPNEFAAIGNNRLGSTPSLPPAASPRSLAQITPGMSPPTTPSSMLPSPASLPPADIEIAEGRQTMYSDGQDDTTRQEDTSSKLQGISWRSMQSLNSEGDLRLQSPRNSTLPPTLAPANGNGNGPIQAVSLSRDKTLPPIPVGETPAQVLPADRPTTFHGLDSTPRAASRELTPPNAPFRHATADRRQSFGGVTAVPNVQTMPAVKPVDFDTFGPRYDDFGASRRSLGRLDHIQGKPSWSNTPPHTATKRKSKFALSSLLGKKNDKREQDSSLYNGYDAHGDVINGYANSTSRHSARGSTYSRRPLEELVQQDDEFLAYRYPSSDQRFDLLQ